MFTPRQTETKKQKLLVFYLGNLRCGLHEEDVLEVVAAVSVIPLPGAPAIVRGVISVRGELAPVLDLRQRLKLPSQPILPTDHFILTRTTGQLMALHVDRADSLVEIDPSSIDQAKHIIHGEGFLSGVGMMPDGLMLIMAPDKFLSETETENIEKSMESTSS